MAGTRVGTRRGGQSERQVSLTCATTSHKTRRRPVLSVRRAASPLLTPTRHPLRGRGGGTIAAATPGLVFPPSQSVLKFMIKVSEGSSGGGGGSVGPGEPPRTHQDQNSFSWNSLTWASSSPQSRMCLLSV